MQGKPVRESVSEYSELALPNDANGLGNLLGGKVMHLVDRRRHGRHAARAQARRHGFGGQLHSSTGRMGVIIAREG